jgi:uncharacterized protein YndB with AHSA1/START domain
MAGTPIEFSDTSYREADGHRIQQLSVVVEAPVGRVWKAFTTDAGFVTWATPFAHITLANGGMMETSYKVSSRIGDPDNIKNRIDCYLPEKLLVIHNEHVPKGAPFDPVLIASLRTIITFEALGADKTRVSEAQVGYGDSPGYETMYRHFRSGNEEELRNLAQSFISGPIDWKAEAAAAEASVRRTSSK